MRAVQSLLISFLIFGFAVCVFADPDAVLLLRGGRADQALQVLNSQIQQNPNDARAYNLRSRVYFQLEHWDDSIRANEKAVALAPQESEYHQWLARSYGKKAEAAGAMTALNLVRKVKAEFEKAVAVDASGKNLSVRADLAEFYIEAPAVMGGDKTKAKQLTDFITAQDPALADYLLARLEEKENIRGQAELGYKKAIQDSGNLARYWVSLASFYRRTGRLDDMEAAITKSLAAHRSDSISLFDAASVLVTAGRNYPGAVRMFREYLSLDDPAEDGPVFQAHYFLGFLFEKQGALKEAAAEYRAALALAGEYRPAQEGLQRVGR